MFTNEWVPAVLAKAEIKGDYKLLWGKKNHVGYNKVSTVSESKASEVKSELDHLIEEKKILDKELERANYSVENNSIDEIKFAF